MEFQRENDFDLNHSVHAAHCVPFPFDPRGRATTDRADHQHGLGLPSLTTYRALNELKYVVLSLHADSWTVEGSKG